MSAQHKNCKRCMLAACFLDHMLDLVYKINKSDKVIFEDSDVFYSELEKAASIDQRYVDYSLEVNHKYASENLSDLWVGQTDNCLFKFFVNNFSCSAYKEHLESISYQNLLISSEFENNPYEKNDNKVKNKNKKRNRKKSKKDNINSIEEDKKKEDLNKEEDKKENPDEILNKPQDYIKPEDEGWYRKIGDKLVYIGNAEDRREYEGEKVRNIVPTTPERIKTLNIISEEDEKLINEQLSRKMSEYRIKEMPKNIGRLNKRFLFWAGDQLSGVDGCKEAGYTVLYSDKEKETDLNHTIGTFEKWI